MRPPNALAADVRAVCEQLHDAVYGIACVETVREKHPFGSTYAVETFADVELSNPVVEIPLETELLPARARVWVVKQNVDFQANCTLNQVCGNTVSYAVELMS